MRQINVFFIILYSILIISGCSTETVQKKREITQNYPDMIQKNYKHNIYKNGRKYLIADINEALFFDKSKKINCTEFQAEVYNSKEELTTRINSDEAVIDNKENIIFLNGNVVIEMIDKESTLYSEELKLYYKDNKMSSEKDVLVEKNDGSTLKASGMDSDFKTDTTNFIEMDLQYFYEDETDDKNTEAEEE